MVIVIFNQTNIQYFSRFSSIGEPLFCQQIAPLRRNKPTVFETFF